MARTVTEIYDSILAKKAESEELEGLTSTSESALFKLFAYVFAYSSWTLETLFDLFKADVESKLLTPSHNPLWYQRQSLIYQHGDPLIYHDTKQVFTYLEEDEEKQIIANAAAVEREGRLLIKVVKEGDSGYEALDAEELAGFSAYINRIKDFVRIVTRSWSADDMSLEYEIKYDPLLMASDGTALSDGSRPVDLAIENYLSNLDFNGRFSIIKLEDAIQLVPAVIDFQRLKVASKQGQDDFSDIAVDRVAESGYMKLHEATSSITYSAANV